MRAAGLLAPTRVGRRRGPRNHDGTITTDRPDELWGTDATACLTTREGNATVFIAVDHCTQECVGIHAARPGTRFEALEPLRQGLRAHHGGYGPGVAAGLSLRHDHGSQYLSDHFQASCASSASARARRSWPHPRATAAPSDHDNQVVVLNFRPFRTRQTGDAVPQRDEYGVRRTCASLNRLPPRSGDGVERMYLEGKQLLMNLLDIEVPVIACVSGHAVLSMRSRSAPSRLLIASFKNRRSHAATRGSC